MHLILPFCVQVFLLTDCNQILLLRIVCLSSVAHSLSLCIFPLVFTFALDQKVCAICICLSHLPFVAIIILLLMDFMYAVVYVVHR